MKANINKLAEEKNGLLKVVTSVFKGKASLTTAIQELYNVDLARKQRTKQDAVDDAE